MRIGNTADLRPEFDAPPYRLTDADGQLRARTLLDQLLPKKSPLGVEPLLTVLANVQANEQLLHKTAEIGSGEVQIHRDANDLAKQADSLRKEE